MVKPYPPPTSLPHPVNTPPPQRALEAISEELRVPGSKSLGPVSRSVRTAQSTVTGQRDKITADFAPSKRAEGEAALVKLETSLTEFMAIIEAKDKQLVPIKQRECLDYLGQVEEAMISGLTFDVPAEYAGRPLLKGRATLEMKVNIRETPEGPQSPTLTVVLDGYNAPVSAGQVGGRLGRGGSMRTLYVLTPQPVCWHRARSP